MREIIIAVNDANQRLDRFLRKYMPKAPLSRIYKAIRKEIKLNGKRASEASMLAEGDVLRIFMTDEEIEIYTEKPQHSSTRRDFEICYEDERIIVVSKPSGLLTHGDASQKKESLVNQVTDYLIEKGDYIPRIEKSFSPSPVHRLDRNTTGLVVFGKDAATLRTLSAALKRGGGFSRHYYTIVFGELRKRLELSGRLTKDEEKNIVRVIGAEGGEQGRHIETFVKPLYSSGGFTLVEVQLLTGRSHQIRAHLQHSGFPLIGDPKYGSGDANRILREKFGLRTQLLHAGSLVFAPMEEPLSYLEGLEIRAKLPAAWAKLQRELLGKEVL
ncbi:MAG: RluA family pseudouridine synthase [Clostridiales bacterium]|nr:RluA family pseudouridine synthase [Clostridiales bacterium]